MRKWVYGNTLRALSALSPSPHPPSPEVAHRPPAPGHMGPSWCYRQYPATAAETLAHISHVTDRGTFVHRGNEYTINNQQRFRIPVFLSHQAHFWHDDGLFRSLIRSISAPPCE